MSREYPQNPVVSAAAVILHEDCVLLIRRGQPPAEGEWNIPGGAVELGETCRCAAQREVMEETNIAVDIQDVVDVVDKVVRDASGRIRYHYVIIDYLATVREGSFVLHPQASDDIIEARWVPIGQIDQFNLNPKLLEVIRKAVKMRGALT
ncbi:MAG: NUDIX hydrolase [Armatimonadota bacterium]